MKKSICEKNCRISSVGKTITRTTKSIALFISGILLLATLTILSSHNTVNAAPFLSPAKIKISPTSGAAGTEIRVEGEFYAPFSTITITFDGDSVSTSPETISVKSDGKFSAKFIVPDIDAAESIRVRASDNSVFRNSASANFVLTGGSGSSSGEPISDAAPRSQSISMDEDASRLVVLKASHEDENVHYSIVDNPLHGSLSDFDSEKGTVTYSPYTDYSGTDRFTFSVEDSDFIGTVSITIREINDKPIARNAEVTTLEESALQITLSGSDVDDDTVTFSIVGVPTHGWLSGTAPNVAYLPDKDYDGYDSFRFRTSDGEATSDIATVAIRINAVNDPPVVDAQTSLSTRGNDRIRITLMATDIDSESLDFTIVLRPEHGTLSRPLTTAPHVAMSEYMPNPNYSGPDSFTFTANDGSQVNGISNTGRVTIMVSGSAQSGVDTGTPELPPASPDGEVNQGISSENGDLDASTGGTVNDANISAGNLPDIIPPTLLVPTRAIILDASTMIGSTVNYETSANDNVDGVILPHCYPRSGLLFPVGESIVKCTVTDKAGNTSERSFAVVVHPFEFDSNHLIQLSIAIIIGIGVTGVLMIIRRYRQNSIDNIMEQQN